MLIKEQGLLPIAKFYYSNGSGRDSYIAVNSGGCVAKTRTEFKADPGRYMKTSHYQRRIYKPQTSEKTLHYHSDGSGRDKYIIVDSGGLVSQSGTHYDQLFKQSLRRIESCQRIPTECKLTKEKVQQQKFLVRRLSKPRPIKQEVPFINHVKLAIIKREQELQKLQKEREWYGY